MLIERESMNWVISSYDSVIPEESSSVVDNWSSSVSSSHPSQFDRSFHLNFTISKAEIFNKNEVKDIYAVLEYNSKENGIFRTFLKDCQSGAIQWEDKSP